MWLLLVGVAAALLCAPFFRVLAFFGDEGLFLRAAVAIFHGKRFYVDFFNLSPGATLLIAAWFSMAGASFGSARALAMLIIVGIACLTYSACRQASRNAPLSAILTIGWLMMSVWPWMQVSHHWFTTLFSMAAVWATFTSLDQPERRLRWPLIAGAAAGAAVMCTPNSGALAALAAMTAFLNLRRNQARLVAYVFGCSLAPVGVLTVLLWQNALVAALNDTVFFPVTRYLSVDTVPFGFSAETYNRPLKYAFGASALLTVFVCAYDWRGCLRDRRLRVCAAFALAGFLGCYPRPDIIHISYTVPLILPLLVFCLTRLVESWRPAYRYAAFALLIALCVSPAHKLKLLAERALRAEIVSTPRGDVALIGPYTAQRGVPEILASIAATPSEDPYFFYPYDEMLIFLTGREHVSKLDLFAPGYTTPTQYQEACRSVMDRASWVVVDRQWTDDLHTWKQIFPSMPDAKPQETVRFEQTLDGAFELIADTGTFELRRRRDGVSDAVCDGITAQFNNNGS